MIENSRLTFLKVISRRHCEILRPVPFPTVHLEALAIGRCVCHSVCNWAAGGAELGWIVISLNEWGINLDGNIEISIGGNGIGTFLE